MALILMLLLLGLTVLAACALMPREIGREDEPLTNIRLPLPDVQGIALRIRAPRRPSPRVISAPVVIPPAAPPEGPSAMGAPQPVLAQEAGLPFVLPGQ